MDGIHDHSKGINIGNHRGRSPEKQCMEEKHITWIGLVMTVQKTKFNIVNN